MSLEQLKSLDGESASQDFCRPGVYAWTTEAYSLEAVRDELRSSDQS